MNDQPQSQPFFFLTDRETFYTYVHYRDQDRQNVYKKGLYYPQKFEKMNGDKINQFQRKTNLKFLWWTLFNKQNFQDDMDYRIALSRFIDLNSNIMLISIMGLVLSRFVRRIEMPFLELMLEDQILTLPRMINVVATTGCLFAYWKYSTELLDQPYLFDLALEYKQHIIPQTLIDTRYQSIIKSLSNLPTIN